MSEPSCKDLLEIYQSCIRTIHYPSTNINNCELIWYKLIQCYKNDNNGNSINVTRPQGK